MRLYDSNGIAIVHNLELMDTMWKRFHGLMLRKSTPEGYGAILSPCNGVHTFFMRFDIDVVYIDRNDVVIRGPDTMKRGRVGPLVKNCYKVLEYDPLKCNVSLKPGDKVIIGP